MIYRAGLSSSTSEHGYRADIDGLRGIAILLVVAFHLGVPGVPGGFVGVDVFFVISGFLITGLLMGQAEERGCIHLIDFYARRVRRILPALTLVVIATLLLGSVTLLPSGEQQELSKSALSIAGFGSNVYFWRIHLNYFGTETQPLLHTWTLAVEEQFYLAWPAVLIVGLRVARQTRFHEQRVITVLIVIGCLVSSALCWAFTFYRPAAAFFLTPFRAWEFGVGGLIAINKQILWSRLGGLLTGSGVALIGTSVLVIDSKTAFPGLEAWLPCIGAGAIILGGSMHSASWPSRALSAWPLVRVGKLSYGWYLWHWPLLAITRATALGEASFARDAVVILIALGLAELTYRFVENPIRCTKPWPFTTSNSAVCAGAALMLFSAFTACILLVRADQIQREDPRWAALAEAKSISLPLPAACLSFERPFRALEPARNCLLGHRGGVITVMWGDSHAYTLAPTFTAAAAKRGGGVLVRTKGKCMPLLLNSDQQIHDRDEFDCSQFNSAVLKSLEKVTPVQIGSKVVLAARWSFAIQSDPTRWAEKLQRTTQAIRELGFEVVLAAEVPMFPWDVPNCLGRRGEPACRITRAGVDAGRAAALEGLKSVARSIAGVSVWDPINNFCDQETCSPVIKGTVAYRDDNHLSFAGARLLAEHNW